MFNRFAFYTEIVLKIGITLYFLSTVSFYANLIYTYVFEGEIVAPLPTYFPGVDENSIGGFVVLFGYHSLIMFLGFVAASACDFMFTMLIVNIPVMAELIKMEMGRLNDILTGEKVDAPLMKCTLRNIVLMHRGMTE